MLSMRLGPAPDSGLPTAQATESNKIPNRVATVSTVDATKEEEPPQDF